MDGVIVGGLAVFIAKLPVLSLAGSRDSGTELVVAVNGIVPPSVFDTGVLTAMRSPTGLDWSVQAGLDVLTLLVGWILGLPFHVFGQEAFVVDNLLIWVGGWLLVGSPVWFWVLKPTTRKRSIRATLRQGLASGLSKLVHRFKSR